MRMDRFTTTAQEALAQAQQDAAARSHAEVSPLHLLAALLSDKSSTSWSILEKAAGGANAARAAQVAAS